MKKKIKLFGMHFIVDGKWLIGESKDLDRLSIYILVFVFILIITTCIICS